MGNIEDELNLVISKKNITDCGTSVVLISGRKVYSMKQIV